RSWLGIGVLWFLGVIAIGIALDTFLSVRRKWRRSKRDAMSAFLAGGFALSAAMMACCFAITYWTPGNPRWMVAPMFIGVAMSFASGLVYPGRTRKPHI